VDRLERFEDAHSTMLKMMKSNQSEMWTAMPGIIQSFDHVAMTCETQLAVQVQVTSVEDETKKSWMDVSMLVDCPVYFPSGGGCTLTFPIATGDECLVVFASRCIDAWWQSGGYLNQQPILRMHDLSDGFAFVGVRSQPRVISNVSVNSTQLRSDDGSAIIDLNPTTHAISLTATTINLTGNVVHSGGSIMSLGKKIDGTHTHSGVQTGSGHTGAPD